MTPRSLRVRALVGPAQVHAPPLQLSAAMDLLVLVTAPETKPAWHYSLGSSPIGALLIYTMVGGAFLEDFLSCYFSVVTRCTSPVRLVLGVHVPSCMFLFVFRTLAFNRSGPTPELQSLTLPTDR